MKWCKSRVQTRVRGQDEEGHRRRTALLRVSSKSVNFPLLDAVLTLVGADNGLTGRLNHAEAAAPEFAPEFSNW